MTSLVSFLIYLPLFLLCLVSETKRNKRWKNIILPKSRLNREGVVATYCISLIFVTFFLIINLIIGEDVKFCIGIIFIALAMLAIAIMTSRIGIIISKDEIIKKRMVGQTVIKISEINTIGYGYFINIKSAEKNIKLETKSYDSGLREVIIRLRAVNIHKNK